MSPFPVRIAAAVFVTAALAATAVLAGVTVAGAQQVAVLVDGEPITELDIAHRTKFIEMSTHQQATRKVVLDELIDEILEIREARHFGIDPGDPDINNAYTGVAEGMGIDTAKLTQMLSAGGSSEGSLKQRLKAQMAWTSLVRGRYKSAFDIRDSDVEAQLQLHKPEDTGEVGYEYTMRPILFVVPRGSPDAAYEVRKRDADALRVRFDNCSSGIPFARALKEVAVRDEVVKSSADLQKELREILDKTEVGHLTPPEQTAEGIQLFAICSKKETKKDSPALKKMRDEMFQQRFGARARHYIAELRRAAMIEYK